MCTRKRTKYYSAHKLVGFAIRTHNITAMSFAAHTHTHTHVYRQIYRDIIFRAHQLLIKNFRDLFFFRLFLFIALKHEPRRRRKRVVCGQRKRAASEGRIYIIIIPMGRSRSG